MNTHSLRLLLSGALLTLTVYRPVSVQSAGLSVQVDKIVPLLRTAADPLAKPMLYEAQEPSLTSNSQVVAELLKRLQDSQVKANRPYRFPDTWQQDKGLYPSEIKVNFAGDPIMEAVRDRASLFDNNMFATSWISICLLEAYHYGKAPRPSDSQLSLALDAIAQYHDKNLGYNNSVMNFWPQVFNHSTGKWESTPNNLLEAFHLFDIIPTKVIEDFLLLLGLKNIEHFIASILSMRSTFERAFHIPPDFDDTFVNLGLGAMLTDLANDFPDILAQWTSHNSNLTSVVDALRHYAYRPFSDDQNVNTIDGRTYFYMRHFLREAAAKNEDIALVPTWVQNIGEARQDYYYGVAMPFQMNNVDVTVAANTVYGITSSVLSGLLPNTVLDEAVFKQVYLNTSSMIASQISHHLFERPDLELTYYPSVFEFYWFTARTLAKLETARNSAPLLPVMEKVYSTLKPALEGAMSADVLKKAQQLGSDMLYFDDFLGDADVDRHNRSVVRGEDRLFTTSVAVNALLSTWTIFHPHNRTNTWKFGTPNNVRSTVEKSVRFLGANILQETYKPWNVFFSGSSKGRSSTPFAYPSNRIEFLNGTAIPSDKTWPNSSEPFLFGVQGYIQEPQYDQLLQEKHFGMNTPLNFTSFNQPGSYFPFWSSPPYTYANVMLALARYDNTL